MLAACSSLLQPTRVHSTRLRQSRFTFRAVPNDSARRSEAELRAQAAGQNLRDLENRVARDIQIAWLNAGNALERLSLTAQLLEQASLAMDLAQSRYDLGLSSIVALSQAQVEQNLRDRQRQREV